ncbi:MAG: prepilin-type N-terminal cleavage/methylation domain-containing protein [Candidatus Omnitrophica bacterium]|nr:prepilin-type N-terminal cleavage/methylation domain-containing protein [Candidatus Omnitrophota bacterium]HOX54336.1 prepilin-type N-terminal cleavage/methylation domain-containing protein [Candidatus Omnitrophota bacterium]
MILIIMNEMKEKIMKKRNAITLMELIVVVVILGVSVGIAVPVYKDVVVRADVSEAKSSLRAIYAAQKVYNLRNGTYHLYTTDINAINTDLFLDLNERSWDYSVADNPSASPAYLGKAVYKKTPAMTIQVEGYLSVKDGEPYCSSPVGCKY